MIRINKILLKLLISILILAILIPNFMPMSTVLSADAMDYDFTDELDEDRTGIGFKWVAETKTLTITGIKNPEAELIVPSGTKIDIQGNEENIIKYIRSDNGAITIKGNKEAILKITGFYEYSDIGTGKEYYASIICGSLYVNSGNIKIETDNNNPYRAKTTFGIRVYNNFILNNGNISINIPSSTVSSNAINAGYQVGKIEINGGKIDATSLGYTVNTEGYNARGSTNVYGKITINGGEVKFTSLMRNAIYGNAYINGGKTTVLGEGDYRTFINVPNIDPNKDWKILYNSEEANLDNLIEAELIDIYEIYTSKAMIISENKPTTSLSISTDKDTICIDETMDIIATVEPADSTDMITWKSDNEDILIVSNNGKITGKKLGTATVIAESGKCEDRKDINVVAKVTLNPNGLAGLEKQTIYTDINGNIEALPDIQDDNIYYKWIDPDGKEVNADTIFTSNVEVTLQWEEKTLQVGNQSTEITYGTSGTVEYVVTNNYFDGTHKVEIKNLPEGVTLDSNEITFTWDENTKLYKGIIKLRWENTAKVGTTTNLKAIINNKISSDFKIEIKQAIPSVIAPIAKGLTYTGEEQELITAGETTGGTLEYSLDGIKYSTDIPKGTEAGEYIVYYRVTGDENYTDINAKNIVVTIEKANSEYISEPTAKELTYTGEEQELITAGETTGGTLEYSLDGIKYSTDIPKGTEAGEYIVYYRVTGDENYTDINAKNIVVTIEKANSEYISEPIAKELTYTGEEQELIAQGRTEHGEIQYSLDGIHYSSDVPKATEKGVYTIHYKIIGDKNHLDSSVKTITVEIGIMLGDIDGDGKINARDAKLVMQHFTKKIILTEAQQKIADVSGDGKINARDAKLIMQYFTKKIDKFPVEE